VVAPPEPALEAEVAPVMLEEESDTAFAEVLGAEEPAAPELDELDPLEGRGRGL
jgi:hypothetical protein